MTYALNFFLFMLSKNFVVKGVNMQLFHDSSYKPQKRW